MCTNQLNQAWKATVKSPAMKLVLVSLADQANSDGVCWPGMRFIAERTGLNRCTILRNIRQLEEAGYLTIEKRVGGLGGGAKSNVYTLNLGESRIVQHSGESCSDDSESCSVQPEPSLEPPLYIYIRERGIEDIFTEFKNMRKQRKKPLNAAAERLLLTALQKLEAQGHAPGPLLETATANSWLSVYAPKDDKHGTTDKKANGTGGKTISTPASRGREALERLQGKNNGATVAKNA